VQLASFLFCLPIIGGVDSSVRFSFEQADNQDMVLDGAATRRGMEKVLLLGKNISHTVTYSFLPLLSLTLNGHEVI
jgi:hypothetical protein